jgi:hypothetical protein
MGTLLRNKPEGWSDERFATAKTKIETFLVDWDWTVAQHGAGGRFAAEVCEADASSSLVKHRP